MPKKSRFILFGLLFIMVFMVSGLVQAQQYGGVLRVALTGEPPMLDYHRTTADVTAAVMNHVAERLVDYDENFEVHPTLAEKIDICSDIKTYTFKLREGILFHNGKELKAEDVVASLERWIELSVRAADVRPYLEAINEVDEYTVEMVFSQPFGPLLNVLAWDTASAVIFPKEIIEKYGTDPLEEYIGTGPYKFVEWRTDRHIKLERFEEYQPVDFPGSGAAGAKVAYLDEIYFIPVPDASTRQAGVQAGDFHYAQGISTDAYWGLQRDQSIDTIVKEYSGVRMVMLFNHEGGLLVSNRPLRQAILATLDMESMLIAAAGAPEFWNLSHGLVSSGTPWDTEVARDLYNQNNPARARELMEEAGYDGEPIRILVSPDYHTHYNATLTAAGQLRNAGFNVELQVVEWATYLDRRNQPELWEIAVTHGGVLTEPALMDLDRYGKWWDDDEDVEGIFALMNSVNEIEERKVYYDQFIAIYYDAVSDIRVGEIYPLDLKTKNLKDVPQYKEPVFWNAWLET